MGSDQSHHQDRKLGSGEFPSFDSGRDGGTMSPGRQSSVCSDSEVPYVSYTVNKPIGESPKKKTSGSRYRFTSPGLSKRSASMDQSSSSHFLGGSKRSVHDTLVVVNPRPSTSGGDILEEDAELARLKEIPSFLPIMRASLTSGGSAMIKDPDILERLDYRGFYSLCQRYENHLRFCAGAVSTEQAEICKRVREIDKQTVEVAGMMSKRQEVQAKQVEKIKSLDEMTKMLTKCHTLLNENIEQIEILNNMLPVEDRLEPFVWTTG